MFILIMYLEGETCIEQLEAKTQDDAIKEAINTYAITRASNSSIWNVTSVYDLAPIVAEERTKEKRREELRELERKRAEYLKLKEIFEPATGPSPAQKP